MDALKKFQNPTQICKLCFNPIESNDIYHLINKNSVLCTKCFSKFVPRFHKFKVGGITVFSIYDYDSQLRELIYKFKGCKDYELKDVFLEPFKKELSLRFKGYVMIPAPSFKADDENRGFNHVIEIFRSLKLDVHEVFEKTDRFKQADHNFNGRKMISKYIKLKENIKPLSKVLLIDDIYTTGNTIRTMVSMLKSIGIKQIKGLVLCKTQLEGKEDENLMQ